MSYILYYIGYFFINLDLMLTFFCFLGLLLIFLKKPLGKWMTLTSLTLLTLIQIASIYDAPARHLENSIQAESYNNEEIEGFILLGGSYTLKHSTAERPVFNLAGSRLLDFIVLAQQNPNKKIVFTGAPLEAKITEQYFRKLGFNKNRIIIENQSRSTEDNAAKTKILLGEDAQKKWVLVTSAFHMPRAISLFKRHGINIIPHPVDFHTNPHQSFYMVKGGAMYFASIMIEYIGLLSLRLKKPL